ncbi:ABC transporter C family member 10 [Diplonema papillatum]|nr:ABC transporter C family member 10 [Diplonema papillatum]
MLVGDIGSGWLGGMSHLIQRKSLRLSPTASGQVSEAGLIGMDVVQKYEIMKMLCAAPTAIFALLAGIVALLMTIGSYGLVGLGLIAIVMLINVRIGVKTAQIEERLLASSDKRLGAVTRLFTSMKAIKFSAWEPFFTKQVTDAREEERLSLKPHKTLQFGSVQLGRVTPILAASVSFIFLALNGEKLTASDIFSALNVFQALRQAFILIPYIFANGPSLMTSIARIQTYLQLPEVEDPTALGEESELAVRLQNASYRWVVGGRALPKSRKALKLQRKQAAEAHEPTQEELEDAPTHTLADITVDIKRGTSVAVVGRVGSGKSSFLSAIVNGLAQSGGEKPEVEMDIGYITQAPFIAAGTVKHNITMGRLLDEARLHRVVELACMQNDVKRFANGLETELGERGTTLSGGQMQRLCIARGLYTSPSLLLADDPLSAVDSLVGNKLFDECFSQYACAPADADRRGRTLIMALNQLQFLPRFDHVIIFEHGRILCQGPPALVMSQHPEHCAASSVEEEISQAEEPAVDEEKELLEKVIDEEAVVHEAPSGENGGLVKEEVTGTGRVANEVFWWYFRSMGWGTFAGYMVLLTIGYLAQGFSDLFLTFWVDDSLAADAKGEDFDNVKYSLIYGAGSVVFLVSLMLSAFVYGAGVARAGSRMHDDCIERIVHAPLSWFEETPAGRLISRFTSDLGVIDQVLVIMLDVSLNFAITLLVIVGIICYLVPFLVPVVVAAAIFYVWMVNAVDVPNRVVKRMANNAISPLLSTVTEIAGGQGKLVIRSMKLGDSYSDKFAIALHNFQELHYASIALMNAATLFAYAASFVIAACAAYSMLTFADVDASDLGLAMTYSFMTPYFLQYFATVIIFLITCFTSVERLLECASDLIPQEPDWYKPEDAALAHRNWPESGRIEFVDTELTYRPGLPPSLKGINLTLKGGSRVGIVGRTGAGKSSLLVLLFRLVEASGGKVLVDGVDIKSLGLQTLRHAMAIIPQVPLLMEGTVRYNIDPTKERSDEEVLEVMRTVGLSETLLNHEVGEGATKTSAGERQLISLARTLLRKARVIVMDEPTSNIDMVSDMMIQTALRNLKDVTIITIAHRLDSIIASDSIVVMDDGKLAQFGSAAELLGKPGIFTDMVNGLGQSTAASLKAKALAAQAETHQA